ncbi:hypothetical protein DL95DRAFT_498445 [Leptodontidium sp. 2 PMI_412]|nr:hypothetical protein DL95DRAFT_498445 [Leptodontidium sp. 2 PMI_412]
MHSARWGKSRDLHGKQVAVIGNGETAVQIIPELAKIGKSVVVFQRLPNWIIPRDDSSIPIWRQTIYLYLPYVRHQYRASLMDTGSEVYKGVKKPTTEMLNKQLPGDARAELRKRLTPNYPPGCKSIFISADCYPALGRPNVTLETGEIVDVTPKAFAATQFLAPMDIKVIGQEPLSRSWAEGASAYKGMTVPGIPNVAIIPTWATTPSFS